MNYRKLLELTIFVFAIICALILIYSLITLRLSQNSQFALAILLAGVLNVIYWFKPSNKPMVG